MKKVAVVLSGCGVYDGAEIHEAVLTLLYLDRAGAEVECFAPNVAQMHVVDHLTGQPMAGETRNVLREAARIARGRIADLADMRVADFDAVVFPGGFGAAKNLCTFAVAGPDCTVDPEVERVLGQALDEGKAVGLMCIAPALGARVLASRGIRGVALTIGHDEQTAGALSALGANHVGADVDEVVVDRERKLVTTPAYMLGPSIAAVAKGVEKLVDEVLALA